MDHVAFNQLAELGPVNHHSIGKVTAGNGKIQLLLVGLLPLCLPRVDDPDISQLFDILGDGITVCRRNVESDADGNRLCRFAVSGGILGG
ncbi:hypothetical protein D3C81_2080260 [compost metagenome]